MFSGLISCLLFPGLTYYTNDQTGRHADMVVLKKTVCTVLYWKYCCPIMPFTATVSVLYRCLLSIDLIYFSAFEKTEIMYV